MIETRPITVDDICLQGKEKPLPRAEAVNIHTYIVYGRSVLLNGVVIATGWLLPEGEKTLRCHCILTPKASKSIYVLIKEALSVIKEAHNAGYHRIDMLVKCGLAGGERLASILGFTKEGVLRCYDADKNNYTIFARVC